MPRCPNPRCQADYPEGTVQCTNSFCQCILPGAVVAGRYRIEALVGMGGMGAVYRASDTFEMEQVALKIMSLATGKMDRTVAMERFRREARYAHQLRHKHIVPVLNFGQDGTLLYLSMPLVTGGTLKELLKGERPLPTQQALRYVNDMAEAIDAVHNHPQKIVHRDIKPSNLLIHQQDGRLVLADFGIARAMQHEAALTQRGWSLGTEHYIAPEQEYGNPEPASDIYAMGVIVYQIFTGLLPYQALIKTQSNSLPPPSDLNPALPEAADDIILSAIETDPKKRPASAGALAQALNAVFADEPAPEEDVVLEQTIVAASNANVVVRVVIPENPCAKCGRENRRSSRFCRHCGNTLAGTFTLVEEFCQVGYDSDRGKKAVNNEDMLLVVQGLSTTLKPPPRPFNIFAVADGLLGTQGKTSGGQEASKLVVEAVADVLIPLFTSSTNTSLRTRSITSSRLAERLKHFEQAPDEILEDWLRAAFHQANQVVYHYNADFDTSMSSTLTTALLYQKRLHVASIGDSRAYLYNKQQGLRLLTQDHSVAAQQVEANLLQPEELYNSARRHQLYRALGREYHLVPKVEHYDVGNSDIIMLCSDGLWHMVRDERIEEILAQGGDTQKLANILVEAANQAGGEGNVSAIVARIPT